MRAVVAPVCLALVALLPGCIVQSLHPLCTEKELVFEPALVGVWDAVLEEGVEGDGCVFTFEQAEGKTYRLTIEEDGEIARFMVGLVMLYDAMLLDFFPEPLKVSGDWSSEWQSEASEESGHRPPSLPPISVLHFRPVHSFWRIWLEGDELRMAGLDVEWLYEQIEQGKIVIEHESVEEEKPVLLLLTADTKDLQQLLREHADDPGAFPDPTRYQRRAPAAEGTA